MNNSITYVAMDTHKKQHRVAIAYPNDEVIVKFSMENTLRNQKDGQEDQKECSR